MRVEYLTCISEYKFPKNKIELLQEICTCLPNTVFKEPVKCTTSVVLKQNVLESSAMWRLNLNNWQPKELLNV